MSHTHGFLRTYDPGHALGPVLVLTLVLGPRALPNHDFRARGRCMRGRLTVTYSGVWTCKVHIFVVGIGAHSHVSNASDQH